MLTESVWRGIIRQALTDATTIKYVQRYRSGHNEAVLKTVCPRGRVGSNPTLCVENHQKDLMVFVLEICFGEVPKRLKGLPWKGSRSLIAVRGFKSRLLRLESAIKKLPILLSYLNF